MDNSFIFINTSQRHQGKSSHAISRINSHSAQSRYSRPSFPAALDPLTPTIITTAPVTVTARRKNVSLADRNAIVQRRLTSSSPPQPASEQPLPPKYIINDALWTEQYLCSALDPFVRLPITLSEHEKSLLHFYFNIGRRWALGTSSNPMFDTSLQTASRLLEKSPIYVLTQLVIAESILRRANRTQPSNTSFLRRAQVYRHMSDLLNDQQAPFYIKMCSFGQVAIMELYLFRPDLQAKHVQAMFQYMETHGGLLEFFRDQSESDAVASLALYTGSFMHSEILFQDPSVLTATVRRFLRTLKRARRWIKLTKRQSTESFTKSPDVTNIRAWLQYLRDTYLNAFNGPYALVSGAFNLHYTLCMTQVMYDYDSSTSVQFLSTAQHCMEQSSCDPQGIRPITLTSAAAIPLLGHVRGMISSKSRFGELELCMAGLDASRVAPLLSPSTRLKIATEMLQCSFVAIPDFQSESSCFSAQSLRDIEVEVKKNWLVKTGIPVVEAEDMRQAAVPEFQKRLAYLSR